MVGKMVDVKHKCSRCIWSWEYSDSFGSPSGFYECHSHKFSRIVKTENNYVKGRVDVWRERPRCSAIRTGWTCEGYEPKWWARLWGLVR